jgi:Cytosol aminopeptidase family, catalytic domain
MAANTQQIVKLGMGAYMGVTQGSVFPPKFIHITYKPKGEVTRRVALVGKVHVHCYTAIYYDLLYTTVDLIARFASRCVSQHCDAVHHAVLYQ